MTVHQVVFPVLRGSRRFFVEIGRRWSIIEHLLLDAVNRAPSSAADLAEKSGLPRRVIVEAFIRLMRAGWVEIAATAEGPLFRSTPIGAIQARLDHLPALTTIMPRWRGFAIEQITGGVFRGRELDIRPYSRLPVTNDDQVVSYIPASSTVSTGDLGEVFTAIEDEDEVIVGVDRSSAKLSERWAVVTVRDGQIEGLPGRTSPTLRLLIAAKAMESAESLAKAKDKRNPEIVSVPATVTPVSEMLETSASVQALYESGDLIVDGPEHSEAFDRTIRNAKERIIIHSTFITEARTKSILPALLHATEKGARVDILWGQDDIASGTSSSREAAAGLQKAVVNEGRADSITVHPFTTNSHAKILVADNGKGDWRAIVGSCNWLASDFSSFEASIRLRDPLLVGELIQRLALLDRGRPGLWHDLAIEMTVLGRRVARISRGNGRTVPMRLLFSPDHVKVVLEARDRAEKRIFVTSHRLGIAGRPVSLLPILSAVKSKDIAAAAYFGRTTGIFSGTEGADLIREFAHDGVTILPVHRPRLHAKVLGWDDDSLAVSSFNWLSADPPDAAIHREIGVLIEAPRLADNFVVRIENARLD
jgi:phosphatidylserine/phosphatidylglycerophosphate/cardiolipin synthase-like enzyme